MKALVKRPRWSLALHQGGHSKEVAVHADRTGPLQARICWHLILDIPVPRTVRNRLVLFLSHLGLGLMLQWPGLQQSQHMGAAAGSLSVSFLACAL